jgi:hypothetical protein
MYHRQPRNDLTCGRHGDGGGRDYFLNAENYKHSKSVLLSRFGELLRKIWNPSNFKGQVSPHEFMQAVMLASHKKFEIEKQNDPVEFLSWLLNSLHHDITGGKVKRRSVITDSVQGEIQVRGASQLHSRAIHVWRPRRSAHKAPSRPCSRSPPISLHAIVARPHMYTYGANVWDLSLVQAPFSAAPCQTRIVTIRGFCTAVTTGDYSEGHGQGEGRHGGPGGNH